LSPARCLLGLRGWWVTAHLPPKAVVASRRAGQGATAAGNGGSAGTPGCSSAASRCPASRATRPLHRSLRPEPQPVTEMFAEGGARATCSSPSPQCLDRLEAGDCRL
jgi:hypothetical protein